jgi:UPF0716 protein FxsA
MLGRLILLFLLTPAVELGLLIQVDQMIGFWPTIGLIIATGVAGSYLARREGLSTWKRLNERLNEGGLPGKELTDGVIILVAGALLVTPGVLTDVVGFMGLLPPTRALIRKLIMKRIKKKMDEGALEMQFGFFGGSTGGGGWSPPRGGPGPGGGPGGQGDGPGGGPRPGGSGGPNNTGGSGSESKRDGDARWEGRRREIPRHTDEVSESGSGSEERDSV